MGIGSFAYLLFKYFYEIKNKDQVFLRYTLILVWFILGIFFFGFYKKPIYDYYFQFMFPLPFFLVGFLFAFFLTQKKIIKAVAILILLVLILLNLNGVPFKYPANRQLNQMKTIAEFVMTKTNNKPFNFALITGGNSDHAYRYFFTTNNLPPTTIEYTGVDPKRKSVTDQLFIVCESLPCQPLGHSLWEIAGFGRAEVAEKWTVSVVEIYKLVPYRGK